MPDRLVPIATRAVFLPAGCAAPLSGRGPAGAARAADTREPKVASVAAAAAACENSRLCIEVVFLPGLAGKPGPSGYDPGLNLGLDWCEP